jgi:hypothetical protein
MDKDKERRPNIEIFPDDVILVSYPKSGSTWLRFLVGNYITNNNCDFANSHLIVPDIHLKPEYCQNIQRPRIIKSHRSYTPDYKRVVYIVRDGRDVSVSYYFHMIKYKQISPETRFEDFLFDFNAGCVDGWMTSWSEHVNGWLNSDHEDFLLIKYEDMKQDTTREFRRFVEFSGLPIDNNKLVAAVQASEFDNMQRLEQNLINHMPDYDVSKPFVRQGKVGGWQEFFSEQMTESFIYAHSSALERLGYVTSSTICGLEQREFQPEIERLRLKLHYTETRWKKTQANLTKTRLELEKSQVALEKANTKSIQDQQVIKRLRRQLKQFKKSLTRIRKKINAMESSKFWKLRHQWIKFKRVFNFFGKN